MTVVLASRRVILAAVAACSAVVGAGALLLIHVRTPLSISERIVASAWSTTNAYALLFVFSYTAKVNLPLAAPPVVALPPDICGVLGYVLLLNASLTSNMLWAAWAPLGAACAWLGVALVQDGRGRQYARISDAQDALAAAAIAQAQPVV